MSTTALEYQTRRAGASPALAIGVLTLCCALWGYSFPVMQVAAGSIERHLMSPGAGLSEQVGFRGIFNGVRFFTAGVVYAIVVVLTSRRREASTPAAPWGRSEILGGAVVGTLFGAGMLLQLTGLTWTLPSVSAFLTSLAVVFAPFGQAKIFKQRVGLAVWLAVGVALAGAVMLSWPKEGQAGAPHTLTVRPPVPLLGEFMTLVASMIFAAQILAVDWFSQSRGADGESPARRTDSARLTIVMLLTTGVFSLAVGLPLAGGRVWSASNWAALLSDFTFWWSIGTLIIFSSVMALSLMNRYQPLVSPAVASVIYCSEPVFSTLFSIAFATEHLTLTTELGGVIVLGAVSIVAVAGAKKE